MKYLIRKDDGARYILTPYLVSLADEYPDDYEIVEGEEPEEDNDIPGTDSRSAVASRRRKRTSPVE